jgi:hypothetical protein
LPKALERVIAKVVVQTFTTVQSQTTATMGAIKSVSDNGQSVTYSDQISNFLTSSSEAEIFSGSMALLKSYRLPKIIENRSVFQKRY